ncbi:MAG TPA: glutamine-hydrolyzing GMP synthase [Bryobacteraceae bacterium]|nr:glutamine-hydrolyzing GMP synthase [Bryobacteraceae bacterium]
MPEYAPEPQITVLDAGGQYCHLIARKIRDLGVYADVRPSDTPASELRNRKGIIISGGPASVYEPGSPQADPALFLAGTPILGICYGQQLMAHLMGGVVRKGVKGEYGLAFLDRQAAPLFEGLPGGPHQVWMSHRDQVETPPAGFTVLGRTDTCAVAAIGDPSRGLYGVQFHPEVVHTEHGRKILENFVFGVARCEQDWNPKDRIPLILDRIRDSAGTRSVFFFVSGGVDSTVAFTLCLRALGADRVRGIYVDTGLMRAGETEFVRRTFNRLAPGAVVIEPAEPRFLRALTGVRDPEEKRSIIGEEFVRVQEEILQTGHFLEGDWVLGQGTIYPDTIESGGTANAAVIKTHHNRVPGIQRLLEMGRIVEPLTSFYKDEVREIGAELGLPADLLERHPFPGPGLAIRCLCAEAEECVEPTEDGWIIPVHSVGVQGDERSYRPVLALEGTPGDDGALHLAATDRINRLSGINRVVAMVASHTPLGSLRVYPAALDAGRLARLRLADAAVRRLSHQTGFDRRVWQFPVVIIPVGTPDRPDSVVLRPVDSVDGMTARSVPMDAPLLDELKRELLQLQGVCAVFYDLTHKPPGTIEWE